ncbi:VanZ family protein [Xylanimonas protaetiae]|uniref:VanZ family protein n=1 Tax=Xylanimonas protaetiae TaxID=2509457 RepID=A0A4P6F535_9MICO|nr:VanZ family protein [Xylanimonas protaetiae]QAY70802.1 VanZ family protein [Xylanimonas protaetiae]
MSLGEPAPPAARHPRRAPRARTALVLLFVVYLALLAWIVLWKLDVPWVGGARRTVKLVPFVAAGGDGASQPVEVVTNLVLFVPFGIYLGVLAPAWRWWKAAGVVAGASLGLEVAQYVLGVGSADVTDLVVNAAGGLAGLGLLALVRRRLGSRTAAVVVRACAAGTVVALLASAAFVASPVRLGGPPPGDGPGPARRLERPSAHRETSVSR